MSRLLTGLLVLTALCLGGCATTKQRSAPDYQLPTGEFKLVVMRPDVAVSTLTARGKLQPRDDWSSTARDHVARSLAEFVRARPGQTRLVETPADAGIDAA